MEYACTAGIKGGVARCRVPQPCSTHPNGNPPAPRPEVVLVKVNLNSTWDARFAGAGIRRVDRTPERAQQLSAQHQARAERLGRDAFTIRESREGKANEPESADSGCPVFCKSGLQAVDIRGLVTELKTEGFVLTNAYRLARQWKPPVRLVLEFSKGGKPIEFPWDLYEQLTATCFGQVDVWANDRDSRGLMVHTVNCGKRDDAAQPAHVLRYTGGDWKTS